MRLSELLQGCGLAPTCGGGEDDPEIRGVAHDSRTVEEGDLFMALVGQRFDGRTFVPAALKRGAAAVAGPLPAGGKRAGHGGGAALQRGRDGRPPVEPLA
ncbi:MAG TPA: UDP-N-acetylmuramoyl-L-alanyl-D-glutamate--2,6-diaminopimelate ligase, partial [Acidobacteria bacterium]|nr:UDP-N-acetylmuramoyl-L-alanyl-D-glutamate--2,6-diaminopimelate ligase [Acidobacteriota bacterium]